MNMLPALPAGMWGGEQAALEIGPDNAVLRLGCARGEWRGATRPGRDGRFAMTGTYIAFEGGPTDGRERPAPARFEGEVVGDLLTLTVRRNATVNRYSLTRGHSPKIVGCY